MKYVIQISKCKKSNKNNPPTEAQAYLQEHTA